MDIINLHSLYHNYHTGVDRYLDMFRKGIAENPKYDYIRIHSIYLTNDSKTLFPKINLNGKGEFSAVIPLPQNEKLLFKDIFWKNKYINVIIEIIKPYLSVVNNPLIHSHNLFLSNLASALKSEFGGKIITHLHCLPWKFYSNNNSEFFNRLYQLNENRAYETFKKEEKSTIDYAESDKIICLSKAAADYLINIHAINKSKISIIRNGLSISKKTKKSDRKNVLSEILYVGKISKDKGVFEMLNALKQIQSEKYEFHLTLAGTISVQDRIKITNKYKKLNIEILGEIPFEELLRHYATCTMGIIPSLHEQCSYVALEMSAFGVPMIVSQVDALAEMFEDGKNVLFTPMVFDPDFGLNANTEKFANNIIRLITDDDLRKTLSRNVRKLFNEEYTLDKMINKTVQIYQEINNHET